MNAIDDLVGTLLATSKTTTPFAVGTVSAVTAGGAADGNALVTVTWQGTAVPVAYGAHYTPAVGHVVLLARVGPRLAILCRLIGTPPTS